MAKTVIYADLEAITHLYVKLKNRMVAFRNGIPAEKEIKEIRILTFLLFKILLTLSLVDARHLNLRRTKMVGRPRLSEERGRVLAGAKELRLVKPGVE